MKKESLRNLETLGIKKMSRADLKLVTGGLISEPGKKCYYLCSYSGNPHIYPLQGLGCLEAKNCSKGPIEEVCGGYGNDPVGYMVECR